MRSLPSIHLLSQLGIVQNPWSYSWNKYKLIQINYFQHDAKIRNLITAWPKSAQEKRRGGQGARWGDRTKRGFRDWAANWYIRSLEAVSSNSLKGAKLKPTRNPPGESEDGSMESGGDRVNASRLFSLFSMYNMYRFAVDQAAGSCVLCTLLLLLKLWLEYWWNAYYPLASAALTSLIKYL